MVHIHGISGVTQHLINGMQPIRGKKLETLYEIQHFYDNYHEILTETQTTFTRKLDEIILGLGDEELRLDRQLQDTIARQTTEVDTNIEDLDRIINLEKRFFMRTGYWVQHWIAVALRDHHIHAPCANISNELYTIRDRKNQYINNRQSVIQKESNDIKSSYDFLKANETYLIGSRGEEAVINALFHLSDEYHLFNNVNLRFHPALFWNETGEWIKTCQIDHIVAGPTGIFVMETKNWTSSNMEKKSDLLRWQVNRSGFALRSYIRDNYSSFLDRPEIFHVVVSISGMNPDWKLDYSIDVVSLNQLCDFILRVKPTLSEDAVKKFIEIVSRPHYQYPRF